MRSTYPDAGHEIYQFAGGLMTVLADAAFTGGRYSLLLAQVPRGNTTPSHFHETDSETLVMLGGALTVETPGRSMILRVGDWATLPPGQVHRLSNAGDEDASYLLLCAPSGFEQFVRRAGTRIVDGVAMLRDVDDDDVRLLVGNAAAYGVRLTDGAEFAHPTRYDVPSDQRETFIAFGATIEMLARLGGEEDGIVLVRAVAIAPKSGLRAPNAPTARFFAGKTSSNGSRQGILTPASEPALLAVTTEKMLRLLREHSMAELMIADGGPLGRLMLVLTALHSANYLKLDGAVSAADEDHSVRRGFPIH